MFHTLKCRDDDDDKGGAKKNLKRNKTGDISYKKNPNKKLIVVDTKTAKHCHLITDKKKTEQAVLKIAVTSKQYSLNKVQIKTKVKNNA